MNRNTVRWGFCVCAVVCGFFVLATCDDFNRPLEDDIEFYRSVTPVTSWAELQSAAEGAAGPGLIGLAGDIELDSAAKTINITRPLTITGFEGRRVIRRAAVSPFKDPLFRVNAGGGLTLGHPQGGTLVLDGGAVWNDAHDATNTGVTATAPLVSVDGGALTLQDGAVLQNNDQSAGNGGGVFVDASVYSAVFTMTGGTIGGNSASVDGGGVFVYASGGNVTFTMKDGTISDNNASGNGGGVFVDASVYSAVFTMKGGTISGNSAGYGGGVSVRGGVFTMGGDAAVSGNSAGYAGGGVSVQGGVFTMGGDAAVSGNSGGSGGGGVYFFEGSLEMSGGTIGGNSAGNGGGVFVDASVYSAVFTMTGGTIGGNSASVDGGGVVVYASGGNVTFTMKDGTINGNNASADGGGVYVFYSTFEMNGGTISGNSAGSFGGGVFVYASGGIFKKVPETAEGTSGVIYGSNEGEASNLVKDGSGNPEDDKGHAVYVNSGPKKRDSTVREDEELDSTYAGSIPGGGWE
ncbi:MAG: hypothetical protein LBO80_10230 [Treponema sp.]|nr:hypothetical protein [Treponema sp.]